MITEDYCTFEVSKLLKEKGFDEFCSAIYIILPNGDYRWSTIDYPHKNSVDMKPSAIMCPTHQMAMKWLREKHKIDIFLSTDYPINRLKYIYTVVIPSIDGDKQTDMLGGSYDTYEQAVEAALKFSLENLI